MLFKEKILGRIVRGENKYCDQVRFSNAWAFKVGQMNTLLWKLSASLRIHDGSDGFDEGALFGGFLIDRIVSRSKMRKVL